MWVGYLLNTETCFITKIFINNQWKERSSFYKTVLGLFQITLHLKRPFYVRTAKIWTAFTFNFDGSFLKKGNLIWETDTAQEIKFSIKDFFSKCDQNCSFLRIWSHLLKKSLMENFIFCVAWGTVFLVHYTLSKKRNFNTKLACMKLMLSHKRHGTQNGNITSNGLFWKTRKFS